jgi:hypothetical protein
MRLEARLKAMALVYDRVAFERGVYDCSAGPGGSSAWVSPLVDHSQLKPVRTFKNKNFVVRTAISGSEEFSTTINSPTEKRFRVFDTAGEFWDSI